MTPAIRFDVVTLFPDLFSNFVTLGVVGRAVSSGSVQVNFESPRTYGLGKHRRVDDTPYGGGAGMVMRVDCLVDALEAFDEAAGDSSKAHRVLLSPQGRVLSQAVVEELAARPAVALICGRYEGFDDRVRSYVADEISIGDYVLSGGELAAMVVIDACSRLKAGVLGNVESLAEESHASGKRQLEYPQFTRPAVYREVAVPEVLLSGNHAKIAAWRHDMAASKTARRVDWSTVSPTPSSDLANERSDTE